MLASGCTHVCGESAYWSDHQNDTRDTSLTDDTSSTDSTCQLLSDDTVDMTTLEASPNYCVPDTTPAESEAKGQQSLLQERRI
jgi:hypothetical protein